MKSHVSLLCAAVFLLGGCSSGVPFAEAVRGRSYTLAEFEQAVVAEKIAFLECELRNLRTPAPTGKDEIKLWPFMMREFPTMAELAAMRKKARPGDQVCQFHHRLYRQVYDGPAEASNLGYALMRDDRIVMFIKVDCLFDVHY